MPEGPPYLQDLQTDHTAFASSRFRRSLAGTRQRRSHHSAATRPSQPGHDGKISAHCDQQSLLYIESARFVAAPCLDGGQAHTTATLLTTGRDGSPEAGSGGHLPPLWRSLSSTT